VDGIFYRFGDFVARFRWFVVAFWVAALVMAFPGVKNLSGALVSGGFDVPTSDSGRGTAILDQEFGQRTVTSAVLIFSSSGAALNDPSDSTFRDAVERTTQTIRDMPEIKGVDWIPSCPTGVGASSRRTARPPMRSSSTA
jgi:RND superfamily putative drug exporter